MSYLTPTELARVWTLRPDVFSTLTHHMSLFEARTGRRTTVPRDGGVRSLARQGELYADSLDASGDVKPGYRAAKPDDSAHPLGAAYHLRIVGATSYADPGYETLAQIGEELGMRAGLHFKGTPDPEHFETNESQQVRQRLWDDVVRRRLQRTLVAVGVVSAIGACVWLGLKSFNRDTDD